MKKYLLLLCTAIVFLISISVQAQSPERIDLFPEKLSQKVQHNPVMNTGSETLNQRGPSLQLRYPYAPVGITYYDLQSNNSSQNRIHIANDGSINVAWTYASYDISLSFPDRGSGFNRFENGTWGPSPSQRIEDYRIGWPSITSDGDGNIILINHRAEPTQPWRLSMSKWDKATKSWSNGLVPSAAPYGQLWPRAKMDDDGQTLHVFSLTTPTGNNNMIPSEYAGVDGHLLYHRSDDAGETWAVQDMIIPGLDSTEYYQMTADGYAIDVNNGVVALAYFGMWSDLMVAKSMDNGRTWNTFKALDYPIEKYQVGDYYDVSQIPGLPDPNGPFSTQPNDSAAIRAIFTTDRTGSVVVDENGKVHVFFGAIYVSDADFNDGAFFNFYNWNGIGYWNEDMAGMRPVEIGGSVDTDGDGMLDLSQADLGDYVIKGTSTFPTAASDGQGNMFLVYSTAMEEYIGSKDIEYYRHLYGMRSSDNGQTWGTPVPIINEQLFPDDELYKFVESVFPSIVVDEDYVHLVYQQDYEPGLAVRPATSTDDVIENEIAYLRLDKEFLTLVEKVVSPAHFNMKLSPNPARSMTQLSFNLEESSTSEVTIHDLSGRQIQQINYGRLNRGSHTVDLAVEGLNSGVYMVKLKVDQSAATIKLVIK